MFVSLLKVIEDWTAEACETPEWIKDNMWWPEHGEMNMAKAAATVYDANVSASKRAEYEMTDDIK